jgi:hypothetical protein
VAYQLGRFAAGEGRSRGPSRVPLVGHVLAKKGCNIG